MPVKKYEYKGKMLSIGEIIKLSKTKVQYQTVYARLVRGMAAKDAVKKESIKHFKTGTRPSSEYQAMSSKPRRDALKEL